MGLPATLHRAHYRRRANPRLSRALATGGVRPHCSAGSRWHRFALTKADEGATLVVAYDEGAAGASLRVDGAPRGQAISWSVAAGVYVICYVEERVGGAVELYAGSISGDFERRKCGAVLLEVNPPIDFAAPDLSLTHVATPGCASSPTVHLRAPPPALKRTERSTHCAAHSRR